MGGGRAFFVDAIVLGQSDPINILLVTWGLLAAKEGADSWARGWLGWRG